MSCELIGGFFEIIEMIIEEQKTPRSYGEDLTLYHSELNFIDTIYEYPEANARELAEILGITQGAVTQVAAKLSGKGLIESYFAEGNKKEKYYKITPEGERVRQGHHEYHEKANAEMCRYFSSLNQDEVKVLLNFFEKVKAYMPVSEFTCLSNRGCGNSLIGRKE